jgi:SRSO17 transposase
MSLEDIKEEYVKKGITHFRLATCPNHQLTQYFAFLVKYFIKEEYQAKFLEEGLILIASSQQNMG